MRFAEAKLQKVDGQMWLVTKGKCQKDQTGQLAHLVERTSSTEGQRCCPTGACACQDVVAGQVAIPDRNLGQKLCVSHSDACDCAPNLLGWVLLKVQTEHPHHCCVVSQDGVWGVAGRVRAPGTFASDTDVGHLLDSRSADAAVYGASLHQHPHVL